MREIVFVLEEESAKALLEGLVPRLMPDGCGVQPRYIVFEGKQDLDKQLGRKLRHYLNPEARFVVLRDQDQSDCRTLKRALLQKCRDTGRRDPVVRIACRELEAFYLGDLRAVEIGLSIPRLAGRQQTARFRNPDHLGSPSIEIERLTGRRYEKVAGSRAIAPHMSLDANRSTSFRHLIESIRSILEEIC